MSAQALDSITLQDQVRRTARANKRLRSAARDAVRETTRLADMLDFPDGFGVEVVPDNDTTALAGEGDS